VDITRIIHHRLPRRVRSRVRRANAIAIAIVVVRAIVIERASVVTRTGRRV